MILRAQTSRKGCQQTNRGGGTDYESPGRPGLGGQSGVAGGWWWGEAEEGLRYRLV